MATFNRPAPRPQVLAGETPDPEPVQVQNSLPTGDILEFDRRRIQARDQFARGTNAQFISKSRAETDFGRDFETGDIFGGGAFGRHKTAFSQRRESLAGQFVGRNVFDSGIFKNAVNRHFTEKSDTLTDLEIQFTRANQDFITNEDTLGFALEEALANITGDEQLRRSVFAQMIRESA